MSVFQAVMVGILYYLSDAPWFFGEGFYVLQRPVVAGFLTGLVMGNPVQGAIIGATINLIYLGHLNVGGSMPSDMALAGYIGTAIAISQNIDTEVALALAVPLGLLGTIFTMEKDYMKKDLREAGVEVFVPSEEDRQLVATRIFEELEKGIVK